MKWQFEDKATLGQFSMINRDTCLKGEGILNRKMETINTIVYNTGDEQEVIIDKIAYIMPPNSVLPLMANQHFIFEAPENLIAWQFNRDFYCIADHDSEVGCVGFLFYGIQHPFFITLTPEEAESIFHIEKLCIEDMGIKDAMQGEMLRTLLKRLIIKVTRIAKKQTENYQRFSDDKMDIIRMFNLLLEANFRKEHEVQFYARAMNKSPKTLANIFGMCNYPAPSKLIHKRIILEAKRYLNFTNKSAKEIAYELGFVSPAHFSRFFKLKAGNNTSMFRNEEPDNSTPC
jgi:AraC family transcriptional regulator, transcriptional activator of pobA